MDKETQYLLLLTRALKYLDTAIQPEESIDGACDVCDDIIKIISDLELEICDLENVT